jgi:GTP-binding protein
MIAKKLHKLSKRVIFLLNKADPQSKAEFESFSKETLKLGFGEALPVSALHGRGIPELRTRIEELVEEIKVEKATESEDEKEESFESDYQPLVGKVAIIGRPNAGKSTLLNTILGYERVITSDIAGTTVDSIDTEVEFQGEKYLFIDTAGVRKKARVKGKIETVSVKSSMEAIRRSDLVLIMIDTTSGLGVQDMKLTSLVEKLGKSCLFIVNKWDTIDKVERKKSKKDVLAAIDRQIPFLSWADTLFISAKTGEGVKAVFPEIKKILKGRKATIPTPKLNDMLKETQQKSPPKPSGRSYSKVLKILYGTQINSNPPKFTFFCNDPDHFHEGYKKFISREIRTLEPFQGTPVKVFFRKRISHTRDVQDQ